MKMTKLVILVVAMATVDLPLAVRSHAGLFKLDFGHLQNERESWMPTETQLERFRRS